ncbi:MAG: protein-export chaperone SecB [Betaproteobacteria bacterium]|jgi:preprotein translocase subunit SecB
MAEQQETQPQFSIEKIYVKDLSLEIPNAPAVFLERDQPQLEFSFRNQGTALGNDFHEVALTSTVTARHGEKTVFLIEATQAGIFLMRGIPDSEVEPVYAVTCPTILLPFLRETVSDMSVRAGFPPVFLAPMNFDALFRQQQQAAAAQPAPGAAH